MNAYTPQVMIDNNAAPVIVFRRARSKFHAVAARWHDIALVHFDSTSGLRPLLRRGEPYPVRRAASFWLNHDFRPVTRRAKQVLRGLVARRKTEAATA